MSDKKEWFSEWFDSRYYHILYQNRDFVEAEYFLSNLIRFFQAPKDRRIIDLACGKGRHAIYLNSLGYDVTGVDLSAHSIAEASLQANDRLHFEVQDLRALKYENEFDIALNLFTSFGYFQSKEEDELVMSNIHKILKPGAFVLIDFMNSIKVIRELVEEQSKTINGVQFHISKWVDAGFIYKKIRVTDNGETFEFTEKVQALEQEDFEKMLSGNGFTLRNIFGDYGLQSFNRNTSDRLILLAQKNA